MAGATFGQLQSRVSARIIDPSNVAVASSNVAQAINDAIAFWKTRKFYFNNKLTTIILDLMDPYILQYGNTPPPAWPGAPVLPSNFLFEDDKDGFVIQYNNQNYPLDKVHPREYDNSFLSNGNGLPFIYTFRNSNYEIYWKPQLTYTMQVNYYADYVPLVNTSDTNDFTNYADKLIEYDAISRLLSDLRLDDARAEKFAARAEVENTSLKSRSRKQNATGRLVVDSILG